MKNDESISIALCTYNGELFIRKQLDSILYQTVKADEIVISDDNSTDNTLNILNEYAAKHPEIRIITTEKRIGYVRNFEKAIKATTGDLIALADQDDIWMNNHIEVLKNALGAKVLSCADSLLVDRNGESMGVSLFKAYRTTSIPDDDLEKAWRLFYYDNFCQGACTMFRRSLIDIALPFPDVKFHDKWLMAAACFNGGINCSQEVITKYRQHGGNVTRNSRRSIFREVKTRHHLDCWPDVAGIATAITERCPNLTKSQQEFLRRWWLYHDRCQKIRYRLWCGFIRFSHYRSIFCQKNYRYLLIRAVHYIFTPSYKTGR